MEQENPRDDLAQVLTRLQPRATPEGTAQRANSPEVVAYLEAGVDELLRVVKTQSAQRGSWQLLFSELGKRRLEPLVQKRLGRGRGRGLWQFEYLWRHQVDYHVDLISYILRPAWYVEMVAQVRSRITDGDLSDLPLGELIARMAADQEQLRQRNPLLVLSYVLQMSLPEHPDVKRSLAERYRLAAHLWADLYAMIAQRYGLRLKDGVTFEDLSIVLSTLVEGVLLRGAVAEDLTLLSDGRPILARAIRHVVNVCIEPVDDAADLLTTRPLSSRRDEPVPAG